MLSLHWFVRRSFGSPLMVGFAVLMVMGLLPASGHESESIKHNWRHTKKLAQKVFFTKAQSDGRFVNVGEQASDSALLDGLDSSAFAAASHTHSGGDITSGTVDESFIDAAIARVADVFDTVLANDGSGSGLDADLLDGQSSGAFAAASHTHPGGDITSGTVDESFIDTAIARVADVFATVLANDGSGSGLDADLLDGLSSGDFATASHTHTLDTEDRRRTVQWLKESADSLATTTTSERVVFTAPDAITITDVFIEPAAALTANDSNYATITVSRRDSDGSGRVTIASITTQSSGTGNWVAFAVEDMGSLTTTAVSDGQKVTIEITKTGLGVAVPIAAIQIEYTVD